VLREHCRREGQDYDEIEKTVLFPCDLGENGEKIDATIEALRGLAELGIQHRQGPSLHPWEPSPS